MPYVGYIAPERRVSFPDVWYCVSDRDDSSGASSTLTLGAPVGVVTGDIMVACYGGGAYAGGGGPYTFTPDPAWTPVFDDNDSFNQQVIVNMFYKIADASDEAGTASYSWALSTPTLAGHAVVHIGLKAENATLLNNPNAAYGAITSISSPGGSWQLVFVYERTASSFAQPSPNPLVTSTATLLCESADMSGGAGGARCGNLRAYASNNVSPITTSWTGGISFPRRGTVVAAVS